MALASLEPQDRWCDKSMSLSVFETGFVSLFCDHTPVDGMAILGMSEWAQRGIEVMSS